MSTCANVIVTYNRKDLLRENILSLLDQTFTDHDILIIDNASTDGTGEMILGFDDPRIKYFNTGANLGGSGGFAYGVSKALEGEYRYAWLMDDDAIPDRTALESLVHKSQLLNDKFSYLASLVYWSDNNIFPMNFPKVNDKTLSKVPFTHLQNHKLLPISFSSFVGCFVNLQAAKKVGLPIAEFFIYGDDVEYTLRLTREMPAYLDMDSTILHKSPTNIGSDIVSAPANRIDRFYYQSRNGIYIARKNKSVPRRLFLVIKRVIKIILRAKDHKLKRIWMLLSGSLSGFFFNPPIRFKNNLG